MGRSGSTNGRGELIGNGTQKAAEGRLRSVDHVEESVAVLFGMVELCQRQTVRHHALLVDQQEVGLVRVQLQPSPEITTLSLSAIRSDPTALFGQLLSSRSCRLFSFHTRQCNTVCGAVQEGSPIEKSSHLPHRLAIFREVIPKSHPLQIE